eukprot:TRINITY_DN641_c0_g1_i4.p3 TRINITY_DN641_c0_g1~~TRINITY_DN641_c0_g1_i4.p3  ORF type:complete len:116 (+),score=18.42 TRINITY_DN641_c0_g1_i4:39-350(+)
MSSGQTLGVKAQRFRGHTSPHRNVKSRLKELWRVPEKVVLQQQLRQLFFIIATRSIADKQEKLRQAKTEADKELLLFRAKQEDLYLKKVEEVVLLVEIWWSVF